MMVSFLSTRLLLKWSIICEAAFGHILYTLYGISFDPGADPDLVFPIISTHISFHVGSEISISGALTGSMRNILSLPVAVCLLNVT